MASWRRVAIGAALCAVLLTTRAEEDPVLRLNEQATAALLYVADYARGGARVQTADGAVSWLAAPADAALTGIDGLVTAGGWLAGIQNGLQPHRVIGLKLDEAGQAVTEVRVIERGHKAFDEPTLGVVVGSELYFVANSQYAHFRRDGSLDETRLVGAVVLRTPLPQ